MYVGAPHWRHVNLATASQQFLEPLLKKGSNLVGREPQITGSSVHFWLRNAKAGARHRPVPQESGRICQHAPGMIIETSAGTWWNGQNHNINNHCHAVLRNVPKPFGGWNHRFEKPESQTGETMHSESLQLTTSGKVPAVGGFASCGRAPPGNVVP